MVYAHLTWVNGPAGGTPLSADRLQNTEDEVARLRSVIGSAGQNPLTSWFHVDSFGSLGGGGDDRAAVAAAVAACNSAGGGVVYFPKSDYLMNTTLDFTGLTDVTFLGAPGARIVCPAGGDITVWRMISPTRVVVDGLTWSLPTADLTHFSYGLIASDATDFTVRNCVFTGGSSGLRVQATDGGGSRRVRITDNQFVNGAPHTDADKAAAACVVGGDASDVVISENLIDGYREEGIAIDGPASDLVTDPWIRGVTVADNTVRDCGRNGINLRRVKQAVVSGNVVTGCGHPTDAQSADGICAMTEASLAFCEDITITGNTVSGCEAGIGANDCIGYTISGNTVADSTTAWSIHVGASAENSAGAGSTGHGSVTGNTIRSTHGGWYAITIAAGRGHVITSNLIDCESISDARGISVEASASKVLIDNNLVDRIPDTSNAVDVASVTDITTGTNPTYVP